MGRIFYTSDLHFSHSNIIQYCNRPFDSVEQMNDTLINNWNKVVKNEDSVYILGDITLSGSRMVYDIISQLKGNKILIKGNHDIRWIKDKRFPALELFENSQAYDYLEIYDKGRKVILCHYPLMTWNKQYQGAYHLYGHIHNNEPLIQINNSFNVGVDVNNYTPVTLDELIEKKC